MFGWVGRSGRRKSAIAQLQAGEVDPRVVFAGLPPDERDAVFTAATKQLLFHGATAVAGRIADARLEVGPETEASLVTADDVFAELGDFARCVTVCEQLVILTDEAVRHVVRLATRLVAVGATSWRATTEMLARKNRPKHRLW